MPAFYRGKFLVAGPALRDPNFFRTVVLLLEHSSDGAMGLVVNRPSSLSVGNALAGHLELPDADEMVFVGGPVEPADLFLLHTDAETASNHEGAATVQPGIFVTNAADQFEAILTEDRPGTFSKVFSGYAGWGPGQMEGEIARGDWLIADSCVETVFKTSAYELWDKLQAAVKKAHRLFPDEQSNPEWN